MNFFILIVLKELIDEDLLINVVPCIDNCVYWVVPYDCEEILLENKIPYRKHRLGPEVFDVCPNQ
jgi:hypothetical protein